jgi:hypothetical protein
MVEDARFEGFAAATTGRLRLQAQILPADLCVMEPLGQVAVSIEGVVAQRLLDLLGDFFQFPGSLRLVGQRAAIQLFGDGLRQIKRDEPFDHVPLVVHDAVDAEVQVGAVELEQLAQEPLELLYVRCHVYPLLFSMRKLSKKSVDSQGKMKRLKSQRNSNCRKCQKPRDSGCQLH